MSCTTLFYTFEESVFQYGRVFECTQRILKLFARLPVNKTAFQSVANVCLGSHTLKCTVYLTFFAKSAINSSVIWVSYDRL